MPHFPQQGALPKSSHLSASADFTKLCLKAGPFIMSGHFSTVPNSPKIYQASQSVIRPHVLPNWDFSPTSINLLGCSVTTHWGLMFLGSGTHVLPHGPLYHLLVICHPS